MNYPYPMARDYEAEISEISATLTSIEKVLNLPKLEAEAVELEAAAGVPNLWDDPEKAQAVTEQVIESARNDCAPEEFTSPC
jgi:peptide chain release factor 2